MENEKNPFFVPPNAQSGSRAATDTITFHIASTFNLLRLITSDRHHIPLSIPHTITFRAHDAPAWYFTSKQKSHSVLRKNNSSVTMDGIYEQLGKSVLINKKQVFQMNHEQAKNTIKDKKAIEIAKKKRMDEQRKHLNSKMKVVPNFLDEDDYDPVIRAVFTVQREISKDKIKAEVDLMTKFKLKKLLFDKRQNRISNGFLQQYIPPSGDYDTHVKVTWTPSMCLVEHRRNKYRLDDESVNIYKRLSVLHNEDSWQVAEALDPYILTQIDRITQGISQQFLRVTNNIHTVRKMVMTMKVDALGQLWFLFFDAFRTSTENYPHPAKWINFSLYNISVEPKSAKSQKIMNNSNEIEEQPYESTNNAPTHQLKRSLSTRHTIATNSKQNDVAAAKEVRPSKRGENRNPAALAQCPSCTVVFDRQSGIDISYRAIIQYHELNKQNSKSNGDETVATGVSVPFEFDDMNDIEEIDESVSEDKGDLSPLRGDSDEDENDISNEKQIEIPDVIQRLEPTLGPVRYSKLAGNSAWASKKVKVCSECAMDLYSSIVEKATPKKMKTPPKRISTSRLQELSRPDSSKLSHRALSQKGIIEEQKMRLDDLVAAKCEPYQEKPSERKSRPQTNLSLVKHILGMSEEYSIPIFIETRDGTQRTSLDSKYSNISARPKTTPNPRKGKPSKRPSFSNALIQYGSKPSVPSRQSQRPIGSLTPTKINGKPPTPQAKLARPISTPSLHPTKKKNPRKDSILNKDVINTAKQESDLIQNQIKNSSANESSVPKEKFDTNITDVSMEEDQPKPRRLSMQELHDQRQLLLLSLQSDSSNKSKRKVSISRNSPNAAPNEERTQVTPLLDSIPSIPNSSKMTGTIENANQVDAITKSSQSIDNHLDPLSNTITSDSLHLDLTLQDTLNLPELVETSFDEAVFDETNFSMNASFE